MDTQEQCSNCYYSRNPQNLKTMRECHKAPPNQTHPHWPPVDNGSWCGEWRADLDTQHSYLKAPRIIEQNLPWRQEPDDPASIEQEQHSEYMSQVEHDLDAYGDIRHHD